MDNYLDQFEQDIQEKPIDWREIFETLLMNWKWFVFSAVLALLIGSVYVRMQKDVYELKSSILIIDQSRAPLLPTDFMALCTLIFMFI